MRSNIRKLGLGAVALLSLIASESWGEGMTPVSLFKVVTEKDEIVIGLNAQELSKLSGEEKNAGAVARALADRKELTVWQYAVRHGPNGELQNAPLRQVGLLAHNSLRVEPYSSPLPVLPHD